MNPEKLSHYQILRKLGAGGMGEVYLAKDEVLGRTVAIKILPAELASNPDRMSRFIEEARAASVIKHPNVAGIFELGQDSGVHFIVMEHVEGATLSDSVRKDLPLQEILEIGMQVADALDEAHQRGIIHRDIKPANIMLTSRRHVKVLDFGLAKLHGDDAPPEQLSQVNTRPHTEPGVVMGTITYMSPEQALGKTVDPRSDIFSLGIVLYELATGRLPFPGATTTETLNRIVNSPPEPVARFNYNVPAEFERIVRKCLEKNPDNRYQTCRDLYVDLKNLRRDSGESSATMASAQATRSHRFPKSILWISLALLAVAVGSFLFLRKSGGSSRVDSIAVLPFQNAGTATGTEYLSDGITESIIKKLSEISQLRVMAPTTVFRYKGAAVDPLDAGRRLKVSAVLTGRVVQQNDRLIVSTDLVDVATGAEMWGDQYTADMSDLFKVQDEISRDISEKLRVRLTGAEQQRLGKHDTENSEAYQNYLKARYQWNLRTREGIQKGIEYFQKAIDADPNYALAYSGLADSYCVDASPFPFQERIQKARAAAEKALQLDSSLAEAHASMGCVLVNSFKTDDGLRELQQAITLNPNYATAYQWQAENLSNLGRHEEAMAAIRKALELDPLSRIINASAASTYFYARRYDDAIEFSRKTMEIDAEMGSYWLVESLLRAGRYDEAITEMVARAARDGMPKGELDRGAAALRSALSKDGPVGIYKTLLDLTSKNAATGAEDPDFLFEQAHLSAEVHNLDSSFQDLDRLFRLQPTYISSVAVDPRFDNLRSDPRYKELCKRLNLPALQTPE